MAMTKEEVRESIEVTNPANPPADPPVTPSPPPVEPEEAPPVEPEEPTEPVGDEPSEEPEAEEERIPKSVMLKRIARENAKFQAANEEAERLKAEIAELRGDNKGQPLTEEEVEKRAQLKAQQLAAQTIFDTACNNAIAASTKENPNFMAQWSEAINPSEGAGPPPREVLEGILELENSPTVLNALAKDSVKLESLYGLRGAKLGLALARLSEDVKKKPKVVSRAPAPIEPVGGGNRSPGVLRDDMTMEEYVEYRKKYARPHSGR